MWLKRVVVFIFILSVITSVINVCGTVPLQTEESVVRITLLSEKWNSDLRVRRAADSKLPDHLSFAVPVNGEDLVLRLKRTKLLRTVTCDVESSDEANRVLENAAVYTDLSLGSTMIVKMEADDYKLKGSLIHRKKEWSLEPLSTRNDNVEKVESNSDNVENVEYRLHRIFPTRIKEDIILLRDVAPDPTERHTVLFTPGDQRGNRERQPNLEHQSKGDNHRHKRAAVSHIIELAFVVDFSDYQKWESYVGTANTLSEMRLWYTYVAGSIDVRYRTINDPDISIGITVTVLRILTNATSSTFISNLRNGSEVIDGSAGLKAFLDWYPTQPEIPFSDHYMLFTGLDIRGISGIAYSARVCTASGLSIVENGFTGAIGGVASHELGHSLSAIHDVNTVGPPACSDNDQFVMAAVFSPVRPQNEGNPWRFSICSIAYFKNYLSSVRCTLPEQTSSANELPEPAAGQQAGEVLSRDDQCRLSFRNRSSVFCQLVQEQNGGLESLCGKMYCSVPGDARGSCQTTVPQEFTPCGTDKWCVSGLCINKSEEITSTATYSTTTTYASTTATTDQTSSATTTSNNTTTQTTATQTSSYEPEVTTLASTETVSTITYSATTTAPTYEASTSPSATTTIHTNQSSTSLSTNIPTIETSTLSSTNIPTYETSTSSSTTTNIPRYETSTSSPTNIPTYETSTSSSVTTNISRYVTSTSSSTNISTYETSTSSSTNIPTYETSTSSSTNTSTYKTSTSSSTTTNIPKYESSTSVTTTVPTSEVTTSASTTPPTNEATSSPNNIIPTTEAPTSATTSSTSDIPTRGSATSSSNLPRVNIMTTTTTATSTIPVTTTAIVYNRSTSTTPIPVRPTTYTVRTTPRKTTTTCKPAVVVPRTTTRSPPRRYVIRIGWRRG